MYTVIDKRMYASNIYYMILIICHETLLRFSLFNFKQKYTSTIDMLWWEMLRNGNHITLTFYNIISPNDNDRVFSFRQCRIRMLPFLVIILVCYHNENQCLFGTEYHIFLHDRLKPGLLLLVRTPVFSKFNIRWSIWSSIFFNFISKSFVSWEEHPCKIIEIVKSNARNIIQKMQAYNDWIIRIR